MKLFNVSYEIEIVCRQHLQADHTREMNPGFTKKPSLNDDDLLFSWCLAVGADISDGKASQCLTQIVKKWIAIRGTFLHAICLRFTNSVPRKELINLIGLYRYHILYPIPISNI